MSDILPEVAVERERQDGKWGGPLHDDEHTTAEFVQLIEDYAGWARTMAGMRSGVNARRRLIQVAALAVAAVESIDRKAERDRRMTPILPWSIKPTHIQLSRANGWRMPPNTIKVDRTTKLGNPFIVGKDGTAPECVYWFVLLLCNHRMISCSRECIDRQDTFIVAMKEIAVGTRGHVRYPKLRGKNLACWCSIGKPCHADVLLQIANREDGEPSTLELDDIMAGYGYRMQDGKAVPLEGAS